MWWVIFILFCVGTGVRIHIDKGFEGAACLSISLLYVRPSQRVLSVCYMVGVLFHYYNVYVIGEGTETINGDRGTVTFTRLSADTEYEVRAVAYNDYDMGSDALEFRVNVDSDGVSGDRMMKIYDNRDVCIGFGC